MVQPVGDKILVRPRNVTYPGLIEIPEQYRAAEGVGEVVRLGTYNLLVSDNGGKVTHKRTQNWPVKVGDTVMFNGDPRTGLKVEENGETLLLIHIGQVRAILEEA